MPKSPADREGSMLRGESHHLAGESLDACGCLLRSDRFSSHLDHTPRYWWVTTPLAQTTLGTKRTRALLRASQT